MIPIPGRQIDGKLQAVFLAGIRHIADKVSFPLFPGSGSHRKIGIGRGPQAESVMMFTGQQDHLHSGLFRRPCPLSGIQFSRVEDGRVFFPRPPFHIGKGIHAVTDKTGKFHLLPFQLPLGRYDMGRQTCFSSAEAFSGNKQEVIYISFFARRHCSRPAAVRNRETTKIASRIRHTDFLLLFS